jgi:hypothetical protein
MALRLVAALVLALLVAAPGARAEDDLPAVARPHYEVERRALGGGTAFFLGAPDEAGAVAVAAAHSFSLGELASTGEVEFQLGRTGQRVTVSSRLYAEPGRSFTEPGATLRDDFLVFALDLAPRGVRVLEIDPRLDDLMGSRVRLLGVPAMIPQDEDDIYGTVVDAGPSRIEVRLDVPYDLRGWGGAPVLRYPEGGVVGILQAAWPEAKTLRLGVAPLGGVLEALERPLDGGLGRPFAAFAKAEAPAPATPSPEATSTAPTPAAAGPAPAREATERVAAAQGDAPADAEPSPVEGAFAISARRPATGPAPGDSLLGAPEAVGTQVLIELEEPHEDSVFGDATGAFVAGRAFALLGEFRRFDVAIVLDTSGSTAKMSGADINGNGIIGRDRMGGVFGGTDPGDSILAAEVAAARRILRGLDPRSTRVALITFAGWPPGRGGGFIFRSGGTPRAALTEEPLTSDFARIEHALDRVLARGPEGLTHMAEGLRTAVIELKGYRGGLSEPDPESEKIVLFFTDGQPTLPFDAMFEADNVKTVLRAADQAARAEVRVHTFAIGPEALDGPVTTIEMASRTGGYFTPVRHPGDLMEVIDSVTFSNIESLSVRNATTEEPATQLEISADGSFAALVPLELGRNRIEIVARTADGSETREERTVAYAPGAPRIELPPQLLAQRNRLLEQRLVEIKRGRIDAEREAAEQVRRELRLEIEREREQAALRAERQRKELRLEVLEDDPEAADAEAAGR